MLNYIINFVLFQDHQNQRQQVPKETVEPHRPGVQFASAISIKDASNEQNETAPLEMSVLQVRFG